VRLTPSLGWQEPACAAGIYPKLSLPPAQAHLAADGLVDAAVLADGKVVLLFRTEIGWIGAWGGFV
jgi:hypothetical protein